MTTFVLRSLTLICAAMLSACSLLPKDRDETANWSAQRIYSEAKTASNNHDYERAIKLFEKLEARYPYGRFAQQAQIETAYVQFKSNEPELAIAAADRFIRLHPEHPNIDYAYYLKGLATFNEDLGLFGILSPQDLAERDPKAAQESFQTFHTLVERFPQSRYAEDARRRMQYLVNSLAMHETHVADYYYRRGAYVAAINRAQSAIRTYPETPAVKDAVLILNKSYHALGLTQAEADSSKIIELNYPQTTPPAATEQPWWKFW